MARFIGGDWRFGFDVDGFCVAAEDWHAHSGWCDLDVVIIENLVGLVDEFHFFLGVILFLPNVDVWDEVKRDLMLESFRMDWFAIENLARLFGELADAGFTSAADSLVGADDDAVDAGFFVERIERADHENGGAVWIGDKALVIFGCLTVDFRNDQRNIWFETEGGAVVDDNDALALRQAAKFTAGRTAGEKRQIDAVEGICGGFFNNVVLALEIDDLAGTVFRSQKLQPSVWEIVLIHDLEQFLTDSTGRTDDGNV